jgi:hypothetical protein
MGAFRTPFGMDLAPFGLGSTPFGLSLSKPASLSPVRAEVSKHLVVLKLLLF